MAVRRETLAHYKWPESLISHHRDSSFSRHTGMVIVLSGESCGCEVPVCSHFQGISNSSYQLLNLPDCRPVDLVMLRIIASWLQLCVREFRHNGILQLLVRVVQWLQYWVTLFFSDELVNHYPNFTMNSKACETIASCIITELLTRYQRSNCIRKGDRDRF